MTDIKNLYEIIGAEKQVIKKYKSEILEIPKYISENLKYGFFDWQKEAFRSGLMNKIHELICSSDILAILHSC